MMRLHFAAASPFARKVMIVLHETGQLGDVEIVPAQAAPIDAPNAPIAHNPLGKIPALERPDGPALFDSRVITRYLDARADGGLYPPAPELWDVLTLEALGDGIMEAALLIVYEGRFRSPEAQLAPWMDGQWAKITRAVGMLEAQWMGLLGGPFGAGQIAVAAALGYVDFRLGARDWRSGAPEVAEWYAGVCDRPSLQATVPVG